MESHVNVEDDQEVDQPINQHNEVEQPLLAQPQAAVGDNPINEPEEQQNVIPPQPDQHIGTKVSKEIDGVRYHGTVINYDVQNKCFRVVYEDDEDHFEDMDEESFLKYLAEEVNQIPPQHQPSSSNSRGRRGRGRPKRGEKRTREPYVPLVSRPNKKEAHFRFPR
ncbi:dirigent protein 17-like isoform X8 [Senna tora]|uniref:Dirigent protein 17-like isoform X8 n=1 Tax=Senna tora TaxID=362788 RepID=A0A834W3R1_9FABA|nr:dirigent protein 17-like isoform X8 [Senna tora]